MEEYWNDIRLAFVQVFLTTFLSFYFLFITTSRGDVWTNLIIVFLSLALGMILTIVIFSFFKEKKVRRNVLRFVDYFIGKPK